MQYEFNLQEANNASILDQMAFFVKAAGLGLGTTQEFPSIQQ